MPIKHLQKSIHPLKDMLAFWEIFKIIRKNKYQVVHTHMFKAAFLGRIAARLCGVPAILMTSHAFRFNSFTPKGIMRKIAVLIEKIMAKYFSHMILSVSRAETKQAIQQKIISKNKSDNIILQNPSRVNLRFLIIVPFSTILRSLVLFT